MWSTRSKGKGTSSHFHWLTVDSYFYLRRHSRNHFRCALPVQRHALQTIRHWSCPFTSACRWCSSLNCLEQGLFRYWSDKTSYLQVILAGIGRLSSNILERTKSEIGVFTTALIQGSDKQGYQSYSVYSCDWNEVEMINPLWRRHLWYTWDRQFERIQKISLLERTGRHKHQKLTSCTTSLWFSYVSSSSEAERCRIATLH